MKIETLSTTRIELKKVKEMRSIVQRDSIIGFHRKAFDVLFPPQRKSEPYSDKKLKLKEGLDYTEAERKIYQRIQKDFGYKRIPKSEWPDKDNPHLRLGFTKDTNAFVTHLNELPHMRRLRDVGMPKTDVFVDSVSGLIEKANRAEHSMRVAQKVFQDVMRMAIKSPDLFIERTLTDIKRLCPDLAKVVNAKGIPVFMSKQTYSAADFQQPINPNQVTALNLAYEYSKYLVLIAYLHDAFTPGGGDVFMKAKARYPGQRSIDYSEDERLKKEIGVLISDNQTHIPQIIKWHNLEPKFIIATTESASSEGGTTLASILMKGKRKKSVYLNPDDQYVANEVAEIIKDPPLYEALTQAKGKAIFDADQIAGSEDGISSILRNLLGPHGFQYIKRGDTKPLGSFYDRLEIVTYAIATGMTKDDLHKQLKLKGIDPQEIFFTAEEFHIGPNFKLERVQDLGGEVLPVVQDPGLLKRMSILFNVLTHFHYLSDYSHGAEALIQDILCCLNKGIESNQVIDSFMNIFSEADDIGALSQLRRISPLIPILFEKLPKKMHRLTEEEVRAYISQVESENRNNATQKHLIVTPTTIYPAARKNGNLSVDDEDTIHFYEDIIRKRKQSPKILNEEENQEETLPEKLNKLDEVIEQNKYYLVGTLTELDVKEIKTLLYQTLDVRNIDTITLALRYWMLPIVFSDGTIWENRLSEQFLLQNETYPGYTMNTTHNSNIEYINMALIQQLNALTFDEAHQYDTAAQMKRFLIEASQNQN